MKIGIIGAGNVGGALAKGLREAGHEVRITSRSGKSAEDVASRTGASPVGNNRDAVEGAEVVILAVPSDTLEQVAAEIEGAISGAIVVDPSNRVDMDDPGSTLDGSSNAERLQELLPNGRVVKAFNTAFSTHQEDPTVEGMPIDGFVAADDESARKTVLDLAGEIGFRPVDTGPLVFARALEAMAALLITLQVRHGWNWENGWRIIGPTG